MTDTQRKRKRCRTEGCRKLAKEGEDLCQSCLEQDEALFPEDAVMHLEEHELDKFNLLRLKVEHTMQAVRVMELEQERADREYVAQKHTRTQMIETQRSAITRRNSAYSELVTQLAEKYELVPNFMGIDDETGVIHDLRPDEPENVS